MPKQQHFFKSELLSILNTKIIYLKKILSAPVNVKKLLLIENDQDTRDVMGAVLEYNEFEVVESQKKMSLQEIEQINPDIIVIDHLLDDGFGSDLCLAIKSNPKTKNIPVILYSASYKIEQIALDSGADAFIAKPFDLNNFLQIVNELALYKSEVEVDLQKFEELSGIRIPSF